MAGTTTYAGAGWGRLVAVAVLAVVAVLGAALAGPWDPPLRDGSADVPVPVPTVAPPPAVDPEPLPPDLLPGGSGPPGELVWVLVVAAVLAASALVVWLARRRPDLRWSRRGHEAPIVGDAVPGDAPPALPPLEEGLVRAREHLVGRLAPADAVVAAWVALEHAAERTGVPRDPAATPTEFTVDVLDRTPADPRATRSLLEVYLRARFGDDPVTARDVDQASDAVAVLLRGLAPGGAS